MPPLTVKLEEGTNLRLLLYGPQKMKKTWWAGKFAEAGFNVVLIDSDDGTQILKQIAPEAHSRINIISTKDDFDRACAFLFLTNFLKGKPILWDDTARRAVYNLGGVIKEHGHFVLDVSKFDSNTVLVLDTWTAITMSTVLQFALANNIDLSDATKTEWDGYRWCGSAADFILLKLKTLRCHVVLVGHQTVYEKWIGSKKDRKLDWSRTQLISTSGPHGMKIGKDFTDILYFKMAGSETRIDTNPESTRDGGCRHIPPGVYNWDKFSPKVVCEIAGAAMPDGSQPLNGLKYFAPGETVEAEFLPQTITKNVTLDAGSVTKKATGLTGLISKK